jgi:glycosyltransferase involved in cell wall biosynthesis
VNQPLPNFRRFDLPPMPVAKYQWLKMVNETAGLIMQQGHECPFLVVITPVFNEATVLEVYAAEVKRVLLGRSDIEVRVIFVDDGSTDESWKIIRQLVETDDRFSAVRLSRNFGAHVALAAGFDHVPKDADLIATLACDLQDPPETILEFLKEWRKGASIVWGARRSRLDSHWRRAASRLLEIGLRRYAMPRNSRFQTGSFFLIERVVLDSVRQFREQARVTFALVAWTGFDQSVVAYDRRMRTGGRSGWTFAQMLNTAYDVFIGFSPVPAKVLTAFGFVMLATSIVAVFYLVFTWLVHDVQVGWTGLMATMTLCFGLLFVMIGISFEYLYRIFVETKDRPLYFVSQQVGDVRRREPVGE